MRTLGPQLSVLDGEKTPLLYLREIIVAYGCLQVRYSAVKDYHSEGVRDNGFLILNEFQTRLIVVFGISTSCKVQFYLSICKILDDRPTYVCLEVKTIYF